MRKPSSLQLRVAFIGLVLGNLLFTVLPASAGLKIYYLRHGETGANVTKDFAGKEDRPDYVGNADCFTPLGEKEVAAVAEKLKPYHFDFIAVSPAWRTRHTILPYLTANHLQGVIWPELAEFSQSHGGLALLGTPGLPAPSAGLFSGDPIVLPPEEASFFTIDPNDSRAVKLSSADAKSNAADLTKLQETVIDRIRKQFGGTDKSILIVGHSNAGRALLGLLTGNAKAGKTHLENTALWMAEEQPDGTFQVKMLNDQPMDGSAARMKSASVAPVPSASAQPTLAEPREPVAGPGQVTTLDPAPAKSFSIIIIPDTQEYLGKGTKIQPHSTDPVTNPDFDVITKWVVDNLAAQKVAFVCQTGDIVDKPKIDAQWEVAQKFMDRLDGKVPYAICVGNHDMAKDGESLQFQKYFPASHFTSYPWYGGTFAGDPAHPGHSGNNTNSYQLFSAGGINFVFLDLECNVPNPVVDWANAILDQYKDRTAIIATHMDLGLVNGPPETMKAAIKNHTALIGRMKWTKCSGEFGNSGVALWDKIYRKHANLQIVFSADQGGVTSADEADIGDHGNTVHCFMADYGTAAVRIYRFLPEEKKIKVMTYDTDVHSLVYTSKYVKDAKLHEFEVPWAPGLVQAR